MKLDKDEKELLEAYENQGAKTILQTKRVIKKYIAYAKSTLKKKKTKEVSK